MQYRSSLTDKERLIAYSEMLEAFVFIYNAGLYSYGFCRTLGLILLKMQIYIVGGDMLLAFPELKKPFFWFIFYKPYWYPRNKWGAKHRINILKRIIKKLEQDVKRQEEIINLQNELHAIDKRLNELTIIK